MFSPDLAPALALILVANVTCLLLLFQRGWKENLRTLLACVGITIVMQTIRSTIGDPYGILNFAPGIFYLPSFYFIHNGNMSQKIFVIFSELVISYTIFLLVFFVTEGMAVTRIVLLLLAEALYVFSMAKWGRRLVSEVFESASSRAWRGYALYAAVYYIVMVRLYQVGEHLPADVSARVFYYALPLFALAGYVLFFTAILRTHDKAEADYQLALARQSISAGREYYENLTNALHEIRVLRHDYKQQLGVISTMLEHNQSHEARAIFYDAQKHFDASQKDAVVYCENPVLSALISYHANLLEQAGAVFSVSAQIGTELPLDHYELCVVIGNLLENAREATLPLPPAQRKVTLNVLSDQVKLVIELSNSFDGTVATDEDGQPLSRKTADGGYGLRSVRAVCELHDGLFRQTWTEQEYTVYVMLNL